MRYDFCLVCQNILKIEIKAKERSVSFGNFYTERVESNRDNRFTTSALLTSEDPREKTNTKCVFCNLINHPPWGCLKISIPQYITILKRCGLRFICFHRGHMASSCTLSNYSCNKCKGKHKSVFVLNLKNQMIEMIQGHRVKVIKQA